MFSKIWTSLSPCIWNHSRLYCKSSPICVALPCSPINGEATTANFLPRITRVYKIQTPGNYPVTLHGTKTRRQKHPSSVGSHFTSVALLPLRDATSVALLALRLYFKTRKLTLQCHMKLHFNSVKPHTKMSTLFLFKKNIHNFLESKTFQEFIIFLHYFFTWA